MRRGASKVVVIERIIIALIRGWSRTPNRNPAKATAREVDN